MLLDDGVEVALAAVAVEIRADPWCNAPPDVDRVELRGDVKYGLVELDIRLHDAIDVARGGRMLHHPDVARKLGEIGGRANLERHPEPELLEHEADRDEHSVHFVLGDADHDGAAVGVGDDEPFVLELPKRLARGSACRLEPGHDPVLHESLAWLQPAVDDRVP